MSAGARVMPFDMLLAGRVAAMFSGSLAADGLAGQWACGCSQPSACWHGAWHLPRSRRPGMRWLVGLAACLCLLWAWCVALRGRPAPGLRSGGWLERWMTTPASGAARLRRVPGPGFCHADPVPPGGDGGPAAGHPLVGARPAGRILRRGLNCAVRYIPPPHPTCLRRAGNPRRTAPIALTCTNERP